MAELRPPHERTCERCGREELWDEDVGGWRIVEDDDGKRVGDVYCLHEWDINGAYNPLDH